MHIFLFQGYKLVSSFIHQGMFADAIKVTQLLKPNQNSQMTKLLLALNLRNHINGESQLSQIIQNTLLESVDFFSNKDVQFLANSLIDDESDFQLVIPMLWKYLDGDQQQLVMILCICENCML